MRHNQWLNLWSRMEVRFKSEIEVKSWGKSRG